MFILVLVAGLFLFLECRLRPLAGLEERLAGRLQQLDGLVHAKGWRPAPPVPPITVIAINDGSLENHPWPWNPLDFSLSIQSGLAFHPEAFAFDHVLDWDDSKLVPNDRQKLPQYEKALRDWLLRAPKVLLGEELGWPNDPDALPPVQEAPLIRRVSGSLREIPEYTVIEHQPKEEFRLSATLGFVNLPASREPRHSAPLLFRYQGEIVPSFVLQAILLWQKVSVDEVEVVVGSHILVGKKLRIPIGHAGEMRVNFGANTTVVGYDDLLLAAEQTAAGRKPAVPVDRMAGAIALLTRTDRAASTVPLAIGRNGSPGEVFAAAIATIQSGAFLEPAPPYVGWVFIAVAALCSYWIPRWKKKTTWLVATLIALAWIAAAFAALEFLGLLLPVLAPLGLLLFIAVYRAATPNQVWKLGRPVIL